MASTGLALPQHASLSRPAAGSSCWRWLATLYFAEGLPATVVASLSAVILKHLDVPNPRIAVCVSALMLPWTLRPLWSPLLEVIGNKRLFVIYTEALTAAALAAIAALLTTPGSATLCILLFALIALSAATHDMAADGFFIRNVPVGLQHGYLGWLGVSFNAAKLMAQGLLVVVVGQLAPHVGLLAAWRVAFIVLAAGTAALALHHAQWLPHDEPARERPRSTSQLVVSTTAVVKSFFTKNGMARILGLILVYRFAEGQVLRIAPLFLLDPRARGGLGLSTGELGALYGGLGGVAFVTGAVLGGWLAGRLGARRAILPLCVASNLPALVYMFLAGAQPSLALAAVAVAAEQLALGTGSIGLKLAVLSAARGPYETAHNSFAGALSGVGAIAAGMLSGVIQAALGYTAFFALVLVASVLPLTAAYLYSKRVDE